MQYFANSEKSTYYHWNFFIFTDDCAMLITWKKFIPTLRSYNTHCSAILRFYGDITHTAQYLRSSVQEGNKGVKKSVVKGLSATRTRPQSGSLGRLLIIKHNTHTSLFLWPLFCSTNLFFFTNKFIEQIWEKFPQISRPCCHEFCDSRMKILKKISWSRH